MRPRVVCTLVVCACSRHASKSAAPPPAPAVVVAQAAQRDVPIYGEFVGQTEAASTVEIRSQVSGFLQRITFVEGSTVPSGKLLFVIDPRQYEAALQQSRANLAQRKAALGKARMDVQRYRPLVEQHAISREQLDTAIATEAQERANTQAAQAQVAQAELNLGYTRISAPMTGRIGAAQVKIGALVQSGATLLDTLYSIEPMYVTFSVSEQRHLEYQRRTQGHPQTAPALTLVLADGSTYAHQGAINMVAPQVNTATGTVALRGSFPNPQGLLKPGLFVRVRLLLEDRKDAVVVPQRALQEVQGTTSLLVLGDDGKVAQRTVRSGATVGDLAVIDSGVRPGERVIVEGAQKVKPGMQATVVQAGGPAPSAPGGAPPAAPPAAGRAPPAAPGR